MKNRSLLLLATATLAALPFVSGCGAVVGATVMGAGMANATNQTSTSAPDASANQLAQQAAARIKAAKGQTAVLTAYQQCLSEAHMGALTEYKRTYWTSINTGGKHVETLRRANKVCTDAYNAKI